jgi:hypothetical protein
MLDKKMVKKILLEVEVSCYDYDKYLNTVIKLILDKKDVKYLIAEEKGYLTLYKYSEKNYIQWLYDIYDICDNDLSELENNYFMIYRFVKENYIEYYVEENITNFINVSKFRNMLYENKKGILNITLNSIALNIRNYANNEYLANEYNLNKKLYKELKKIQKEVK